jgi:histidinol dehydrogenase
MEVIRTREAGWREKLKGILARMTLIPSEVDERVREILASIAGNGDESLAEYTLRFDGFDPQEEGFVISPEQIRDAASRVEPGILDALKAAALRIESYHSAQKERSWIVTEDNGMILGQKVTPVGRAGVYIPGGRNAFPSTLLMNVIPARIAGVEEIIVVSPTPGGVINDALLAAAHTVGVERIYRIGGAQAVAALAYGTETIPAVDKIVGPGNIYVAHAKRLVQDRVGIDAFAGPSEILVIADEGADPDTVALDLLSQAEHDPMASAILAPPYEGLAQRVMERVAVHAKTLPRKEVLDQSLRNYAMCVITNDLEESFAVANMIAPEHLELMWTMPSTISVRSGTQERYFSDTIPPKAWETMSPGRIIPCRRPPRPGSHPLWVSMTSSNDPPS